MHGEKYSTPVAQGLAVEARQHKDASIRRLEFDFYQHLASRDAVTLWISYFQWVPFPASNETIQ